MSLDQILIPSLILAAIVFISFIAGRPTEEQSRSATESSSPQQMYGMLFASELSAAVLDQEMNILFCNNRFAELLNDSPFQLNGTNFLSRYPFSKNDILFQTLEKIALKKHLLTKPMVFGIKASQSDSSNEEIDFFALIRSFKEKEQNLIWLAMTFPGNAEVIMDDMVKSLKQKDSDLKKLEEIDQLKSEFLATLSHELKTPLVSIKGYMDLMESEKFGPLTEGQRKALRISLKNTSHLNSMISSILNFARMEAGKLKFDLVGQRINSMINDTVDSMKPISDKSQVEVIAECPGELPWVLVDAELINRVLINLIDNAIKFSEPGTIVSIKAELTSSDQVKVSVNDQGCGIPEDKIDMIKRPFYQADKSDTRPRGGLGLGLAICEKILAGHGTTLAIESKPGIGTSFSFLLKTTRPRSISSQRPAITP
ncbi:MAG: PAS domain-containing sensor histidine kinase [Candidatus Riflebacteria bacterium]